MFSIFNNTLRYAKIKHVYIGPRFNTEKDELKMITLHTVYFYIACQIHVTRQVIYNLKIISNASVYVHQQCHHAYIQLVNDYFGNSIVICGNNASPHVYVLERPGSPSLTTSSQG